MMDSRAWHLKVAIVRIELAQKDPTFYVRSLPPDHSDYLLWDFLRSAVTESSCDNVDRPSHALEIAALDAWAIWKVMRRLEKNDNLREVMVRAERYIREAILPVDNSHQHACTFLGRYFNCFLQFKAASPLSSKQAYFGASEWDSELAIAYTLHAFLTSVLHLLTSVFQYPIGYVDRGGSKTYSSGSFDFRASFVALVLFQGAYVWIKFRQAAPRHCRKRKAPDAEQDVVDIEGCKLKGLHKRAIRNSSGAFIRFKYEPRFTPPRQEGDHGTDKCSKRLPLGEYHTPVEAQIVLQVARYYYDKDGGCVELEDGRYKFPIPPMSEQERGLVGMEKRTWVIRTAKQVGKQIYADFQREKKEKHSDMAIEVDSHGAESNDLSSSITPLPCSSLPVVPEPAIGSIAPSSRNLPYDGATVPGEASVFSEALPGFEDMLAVLLCDSGSPELLDQPSSVVSYQMQYQGFAQFHEDSSLPEVGSVAGGIEHVSEPELNPIPSFQQGRTLADAGTENIDGSVFLQQSDPVLQQVVICPKCLGNNATQFVPLDQLKVYPTQNSTLQQENESLKRRLQQVTSFICNLD